MTIAIIPAKGTSIRLSGKNKLPLGGIEVYQHSVNYAIQEKIEPIVSTDSEDIISWCIENNVKYYREKVDDKDMCNCINQVLSQYACDYFVVLQPTSPIRQKGLLSTLRPPQTSIYTANKVKIIGHIGDKFNYAYRDQDCKNFLYHHDGNMIYVNTEWYKKERKLFCDESEYLIEGLPYTLQIDTIEDYETIKKLL